MILYAATSNRGKLRDFALASTPGFEIRPLPSLADIAAPEEDQATFEGNARLKAVYYSRFLPGEIVLADDSGLEVDALAGAPGVYSARYAELAQFTVGPDADARNNACLLAQLGSAGDRRARYRCVLAAARDGVVLCTADGTVEGEILTGARGTGGFGYDPLFYLPALARTMAELTPEVRLSLSHRGRALRALLQQLDAVISAAPHFLTPP
jgi:XTP/dITP diphosphohydrolase